jgi:hypothetical protein
VPVTQLVEQLICNSRRAFGRDFIGSHTIADAERFSHSAFAPRYAELRRSTAKNFHVVENDREKHLEN